MNKIKVVLIKENGKVQEIVIDTDKQLQYTVLLKNRLGQANLGNYSRDYLDSIIHKHINIKEINESNFVILSPYNYEKPKCLYNGVYLNYKTFFNLDN